MDHLIDKSKIILILKWSSLAYMDDNLEAWHDLVKEPRQKFDRLYKKNEWKELTALFELVY